MKLYFEKRISGDKNKLRLKVIAYKDDLFLDVHGVLDVGLYETPEECDQAFRRLIETDKIYNFIK